MEAGEACHGSEPVVGAWPMGSNRVESGATNDTAQHGGDDDGIVGVAEDRYEVGNKIDRNCEVGQQQSKPDANPRGSVLSAAS